MLYDHADKDALFKIMCTDDKKIATLRSDQMYQERPYDVRKRCTEPFDSRSSLKVNLFQIPKARDTQ